MLKAAFVVMTTTQMMLGDVVESIIDWGVQVAVKPTRHIHTDHPGKNGTRVNHLSVATTED